MSDLRLLSFPLPPYFEQRRIVAEVERRLSVIDELEMQVEANLKRAERLREAILKRAFEGNENPGMRDRIHRRAITPAAYPRTTGRLPRPRSPPGARLLLQAPG